MADPKILTVNQLSLMLKQTLEIEFPEVWVGGEISNLSKPQSGHYYFTLKDDQAQIRGVVWRSTAERMKYELKEGMQVVCCGYLDLYPPRGSYQLVVRFAEPTGLGPLQVAFKQLHEKLKNEGLFNAENKQPLPQIPARIAVITSPTGAAVRDFLQVLQRRWKGAEITIIPSRVQGDQAVNEIVRALKAANRIQPHFDLIVLTRGGGSLEDLWCFNEEAVVRAIFDSRLPVITAIGHEIDVTLSDLVADERALTPSEAAEKIVPSRDELARRLNQIVDYLNQLLFSRLESAYQRLTQIESRPIFRRPLDNIHHHQRNLDDLESDLHRSVQNMVERLGERIASNARQLEGVSPLAVLQRGYSVTQAVDPTKKLIDSVKKIKNGDLIQTQVADGQILSRVESATAKSPETTQ